jgi:hypothetical protein
MSSSQQLDQLEQALAGLLTPDNNIIKQSRQYLFQLLKAPNSIVGLMNRVDATQNQNTGTRQVSAVLLRKVINKHWGRLDAGTRQQVQTALLHMLTQEPEVLVRRALGAVIARLSKHLLPGWTDMLQLVQACANQTDPRYREQAYLLLYQSSEPVGRTLETQFPHLCQLYCKGLQDSDPSVRVMALKASSGLVSYVSKTNHVMHFQPLVPYMYAVVRDCAVTLGEDSAASLGLECFVDLALSQAPILKGHVGPLGQFALDLGINRNCDIFLRDSALQVIVSLCESKPKSMSRAPGRNVQQSGGLMREAVTAMIQMCMEVDDDTPLDLSSMNSNGGAPTLNEDEDEDEDEADRTPSNIGLHCLDRLACVMPNRSVYPVARDATLAGIASGAPKAVSASLFSLGAIAEGCSGALMDDVDRLMPIVLQCANHSDERVRGALCHALSMFSMYLGEEMFDASSKWTRPTLELVLQLYTADGRWYTRSKCLFLLEMLCERTPAEVLTETGYLQPIMQAAQDAIRDTSRLDLQKKGVAVICSVVISIGSKFSPYFEATFPMLRELADDADEARSTLRGEAIQCIGHMAAAAGPEAFGPAVMDVMAIASRCMATEDAELVEYVFNFFGSVAECLGPQFSTFLPDLVPVLLDACLSNRALEFHEVNDADLSAGSNSFNFDEEENEASTAEEEDIQGASGDDDDDGVYKARIRTGLMDLKEAAVVNLGRIAAACAGYEEGQPADVTSDRVPEQDPFAPYVERTLTVMQKLTNYFHEQVRVTSLGVLRNIVLGSFQVSKRPGNMQNENQRRCAHIVSIVLPMFVHRMNKDFHREVAAVSVESVDAIVSELGSGCVENLLDPLAQQLLLFLQGNAACQEVQDDLDDEDDENGEGEDHDFVLMDSVTDLVGTLARAFGSRFVNHAQPLLEPLGRFLAPNRPHTDRSMAIGCYGELVQGMGAQMGGQHCASMAQIVLVGMRDSHHEVKVSPFTNFCYCYCYCWCVDVGLLVLSFCCTCFE